MKRKCLKCGLKWNSIGQKKPRVCPKCKSYYWDEPRARKEYKSYEEIEAGL